MQRSIEALEHVAPLLDQLPIGVQVVDAAMRYLYLNQVAADHGKSARDRLLGRTMQECYPGIESTPLFHHIRATLDGGQSCELENAFDFPDLSQGWFELRIFRFLDAVAITSVDITQRKRLQLQRRHSQRMDAARQLAGGIAHDFNNLLTIVGSYTELVFHDSELNDRQRSDLEEVLSANARARDLTERLTALSRHAKGEPAQLSLDNCLSRLVRTLTPLLGEEITLHLVLDNDLGTIEMDAMAFDQVVVSLALKSRDAMNGSGTLTIAARRLELSAASYDADRLSLPAGSYCEVAFSDTRPKIPAAQLDQLFDPRLEATDRIGTGLGLAMCWSIVDQAGGTILVESGPGASITFRVVLPRVLPEAPPPQVATAPRPSPAGRRASVLVVDDEAAIRRLIVRHLESAGHTAIDASNGEEALSKLVGSNDFDLVVSDVLMPGMGGFELARRLRELAHPVQVLLISGYVPAETAPLSRRHWPLLTKPFTRDTLLDAVNALLAPRLRP